MKQKLKNFFDRHSVLVFLFAVYHTVQFIYYNTLCCLGGAVVYRFQYDRISPLCRN